MDGHDTPTLLELGWGQGLRSAPVSHRVNRLKSLELSGPHNEEYQRAMAWPISAGESS